MRFVLLLHCRFAVCRRPIHSNSLLQHACCPGQQTPVSCAQHPGDVIASLCVQVKPQTVSNLLWAYATLGWAPTHLLTSLAIETLRQLPYFKPQELANTLWSYATLGFNPMPEWLGQMGVACESQIGGCKPQELSSLIWALGSLRHHSGAAFLRNATESANRSAAAQSDTHSLLHTP